MTKKITSLELLELINKFRSEEKEKAKLTHYILVKNIGIEFAEEITTGDIVLTSSMIDDEEVYELTIEQAKQMLFRETKFVRKSVIAYFDRVCFSGSRKVLAIGDLHAPFIKEGYLEFCQEMYEKHGCTDVVFLGDIIDNHFSSFHDTDPDGHGAGEELERAIEQIGQFYRAFPKALVCNGNHDNLGNRRAFSSGLSKRWIKSFNEILETPKWKYSESHMIGDFIFTHGTGRKAKARCLEDSVSIVQGHYHSESYVDNFVGIDGQRKVAVQVGCGIERSEYAFAYGKHFKAPHINVAIIDIDRKTALLEYMD